MGKWLAYEQLKAQLKNGKLTPEEYERAIRKLVRELKL